MSSTLHVVSVSELRNYRDDKHNVYRSYQDLEKVRGLRAYRVVFYGTFRFTFKEWQNYIQPLSFGFKRNYWHNLNGKLKRVRPENYLIEKFYGE